MSGDTDHLVDSVAKYGEDLIQLLLYAELAISRNEDDTVDGPLLEFGNPLGIKRLAIASCPSVTESFGIGQHTGCKAVVLCLGRIDSDLIPSRELSVCCPTVQSTETTQSSRKEKERKKSNFTFWRPLDEKEILAKARDRSPELFFLCEAIFSLPEETDLSEAIRGTTLESRVRNASTFLSISKKKNVSAFLGSPDL